MELQTSTLIKLALIAVGVILIVNFFLDNTEPIKAFGNDVTEIGKKFVGPAHSVEIDEPSEKMLKTVDRFLFLMEEVAKRGERNCLLYTGGVHIDKGADLFFMTNIGPDGYLGNTLVKLRMKGKTYLSESLPFVGGPLIGEPAVFFYNNMNQDVWKWRDATVVPAYGIRREPDAESPLPYLEFNWDEYMVIKDDLVVFPGTANTIVIPKRSGGEQITYIHDRVIYVAPGNEYPIFQFLVFEESDFLASMFEGLDAFEFTDECNIGGSSPNWLLRAECLSKINKKLREGSIRFCFT